MSDKPSEPKQRRRWWRWALFLLCLLVGTAFGVRAALPGLVRAWLVETLAAQLNIDIAIADVDMDLANDHIVLTDLTARIDGDILATSRRVDVELDVEALIRGETSTIRITFEQLHGEIRLEEGGTLNVSRIAPAVPSRESEPAAADQASTAAGPVAPASILLDFHAKGATIRYTDDITDKTRPLDLLLQHASITATQVRVSGPEMGAPLTDVRLLGAIQQDIGPALLAAGFWEGLGEEGRYLELHAALTAFDVSTVPQYLTPNASRVLGGHVFHASGTAIAHHGTIEQGLIGIDVEDSRSNLELRFGGPLDAPVFDIDSPVFEVFRLSYLRAVDGGSSLFSKGTAFGKSLWDRSSGLVADTASGVGTAVSDLSLKKLGQGIWKGIKGLFSSADEDDRQERIERWAGYARRQLAFRELFMERRLGVAKDLEPSRVPEFEKDLADEGWKHALDALIPEASRAPQDAPDEK